MVEKQNTVNKQTPNGSANPTATTNQNNVNSSNGLNFVRSKLENFQTIIIQDVEKRMTGMIDEIMQEMRQHELQLQEFKNFSKVQTEQTNTWNNRIAITNTSEIKENNDKINHNTTTTTSTGTGAAALALRAAIDDNNTTKVKTTRGLRSLPDKIFVTRESYLTALLEVDHMKAIYHIFYVILVILLMNSILHDYIVEGSVFLGLGTFKLGLSKIHYVFGIWLLEHVFVFILFYAFKGWALIRTKLHRQQSLQRFWSHSCLITYISSQLLLGYVASAMCLKLNLPFVTASVLLLESTRLLMKMHAFVRTNASRVLAGKLKVELDHSNAENTKMPTPSFSSYLYFLFAPTLLYRDSYPRTSQIRWKFALSRLMEVIAIAFLYSYIFERHIKVHFANYGIEELQKSALVIKFFGMIMPSVIIFLCGFYLILHAWLNFTAELLRFGDRMFYKDWWTSSSHEAYFRNWNIVVHDWLYEYIYKDFYNHIFKGSKVAASMMVFTVSALVHEHILGFGLQLFFPIMMVFFEGISVPLVFFARNIPKNLGNFFLWFTLILGNGIMISLYSMENYARYNCPKTYNTWIDYLTPAVINCYKD